MCAGPAFWAYLGDAKHPYSVYDFTHRRTRDGPMRFLENYSGYLHADAYTGYDAMFLDVGSGVIEVACWSHARRKFFDAVQGYPREAHQVLEWIWQLSDLEDRARELSVEARRALRFAESNPVLDKIEAYLAELARDVLPKSHLAKAVTYARNQWEALRRDTQDGRLTMDNNVSERTLRHQAVGRKNGLFLGSEAAGPRAAVLYTVLAGAKRHRIDPWAYVHDLLLRLHADDTRLEENASRPLGGRTSPSDPHASVGRIPRPSGTYSPTSCPSPCMSEVISPLPRSRRQPAPNHTDRTCAY